MSGFGGIGAIASVQDMISITRTVRAAMVSLNVSFASWEKSVEDQQQLLAGKSFKAIPLQPRIWRSCRRRSSNEAKRE